MELWTILLQLLAVLALLYWYVSRRQSYWAERGVTGPKPAFLFGDLLMRAWSTPKIETELRNRYGRVYGNYNGIEPILTVADPELIKQVMVKDFGDFVNRRVQNTYHEAINENLFSLDDEKWKALRSIVTPAFTSGKLRGMQVLMNKCVDKLIVNFDKVSTDSKVFKTKEVITKFTIDVIASTSFAVDTNSDQSEEMSPFVKHALEIFDISPLRILPLLMFPLWLNNLLGIKIAANYKSAIFFIELVYQVIKQRKANPNFRRNDLVQLLLDAKVDLNEVRETSYDKLSASMNEGKHCDDLVIYFSNHDCWDQDTLKRRLPKRSPALR